jgi:ribonuclease T
MNGPKNNQETFADSDQAPVRSPLAMRFRGFLPVVVDIETGGFNADTDALLQIGAVLVGMDNLGFLQPCKSLFYQVSPFAGANLEPAALEFNGIDPYAESRQAVDEASALHDLFKHVRKAVKSAGCTRAILVGHNANFDHSFLMRASERCDIKRNPFHPFSTLDTVSLSALAFGQTVLAKACEAAAVEFDAQSAHTADYDAARTADLFCEIVNRWQELGGWHA